MKNCFYLLVLFLCCSCSEFVDYSQIENEKVSEISNEDSIRTRGMYGDYWIEGGNSMAGKSTSTFYLCVDDNWLFSWTSDITIYIYGNIEVQGSRDGIIKLNASVLEKNNYTFPFDIKALDTCGSITIEVLVNGNPECSHDIDVYEPGLGDIPSANIKYCSTTSHDLLVEIPRTAPETGNWKMEWENEPIIMSNESSYTYTRTEEMGYNYLYFYIPKSEQISPGEPEYVPVYRYIFKKVDGTPMGYFHVKFRTKNIYNCSNYTSYCYEIKTNVADLNTSSYGFVLPEGDATQDGGIIKSY